MIKNLTKEEDFSSFLENNKNRNVLVNFFTTECLFCLKMKIIFENFNKEEKSDNFAILKINANKFENLSNNPIFSILHVPTSFIIKDNKIIEKIAGIISYEKLKELLL